jgi:DNA (cytosine-5)-methyltransferase 1
MKPHVFSFFAGAGFLDLGFEDEGFETVFANEIYPPFARAYEHSRAIRGLPPLRYGILIDSVEAMAEGKNFRDLKENVKNSQDMGALVGFIGGPPCPDFSIAGKNRGSDGENGRLSKTYVDLIIEAEPDFFLFENVKGLYRTKKHREFFDSTKKLLEEAGFVLEEKLINSLEYGAPQDRERIILLGIRKSGVKNFLKEGDWSRETSFNMHEIQNIKWPDQNPIKRTRTKPKDIEERLTVQYWFDKNNVESHPNQKHAFTPRAGLARFQSVLEGDVSRKSYKRLHRWRYSPTAAYGNNEVHIHPFFPRRISAAEALSIQSLPASYEFPQDMTLSAMFKAIGNGVPYVAARGIARMYMKALKREFK